MTIQAVEGGAGCGKTYRLMGMLSERLITHPLKDGQRILALTFMHGSRKRLAERLHAVPALKGRVECCTIDALAWRIFRRWRGLAAVLGIAPSSERDYDDVCDAAGHLLEQQDVRNWVAASYPIVLVDEGQDLKPQRLRMLKAMSQTVHALVAADEFQCLDQALRPNPLVAWLHEAAQPEPLIHVRRTEMAGLLAAATAIRSGAAPVNGYGFKLLPPGMSVPLAATFLSNAIAWRKGDDVAVITPALRGGFAQKVVDKVTQGPCGRKKPTGPYPIHWERNDQDEALAIIADLHLPIEANAAETCAALRQLPRSGPARATLYWVENQIHACGRSIFTRAEIEDVLQRQVSLRRQHGGGATHRFTAMTVQQAKNREFDGVVVIWPYQVGGDDEHKRRLLYNAITRAKRWCHIIVQHPAILAAAPFL